MTNSFELIQMERKLPPQNEQIIRLLAVATFQNYHGYERIIKGLAQHYHGKADRKIELYMVGNGRELIKYKKMVKQYALEKSVQFCGRKIGPELDHIYDYMDIALGSFGMYKEKVYKSSSLKVREYLAKGMPVVCGCRDDAFEGDKSYKYYLEFPNDNTVVNMQMIVDFYRSIYEADRDREQIHREIREYAKKTVDLSVTMRPVMEYICS